MFGSESERKSRSDSLQFERNILFWAFLQSFKTLPLEHLNFLDRYGFLIFIGEKYSYIGSFRKSIWSGGSCACSYLHGSGIYFIGKSKGITRIRADVCKFRVEIFSWAGGISHITMTDEIRSVGIIEKTGIAASFAFFMGRRIFWEIDSVFQGKLLDNLFQPDFLIFVYRFIFKNFQ